MDNGDLNLKGTKLGKYDVEEEIGRGGMGAVYRGYDPTLGRRVAIKVLAPHLVWEKAFVERFVREAQAAAQIKHPNIVTIYDVGQEGSWHYFVMEYLEGETLTGTIQRRGQIPAQEALDILRQLAEALDYAHGRGLVHRDVKPSNVMMDATGHATLNDFGIVQAAQGSRLTATGTMIGTLEYMSPEQMQGVRVGPRSDQYSLGVVAYEMLTGRVPFKAESTAALIHKVVYDAPPSLHSIRPDLSQALEQVLSRVLAKDATARYASGSELIRALEQAMLGIAATEGARGRPTGATQPAGARATRTPPPSRVPATGARATGKRSIPTVIWALGGGALALFLLMAVIVGVIIVAGSGGDDSLAASPPEATAVALGASANEETATPAAELPPTEMPAPTEEPIVMEEAAPALPPEPTALPTSMPEATVTPVPAPTDEPTAAPLPTPSQEPTATQPAGNRATITDVQVSGDRYAVYFDVYNFQPVLPGVHLHFFFDTVPPDQAGLPGGGPWLIYPASSGGPANSPFTGYGAGDRPAAASQMCVLVANGDHSVQPNTGNCYYLP